MILGGEQPVALPTMDWYDKDMMKLYLAAIKDDYDKAVKREDDFFEKYGDFIAATSKDLQFINDRVINPVVLFVNNNPDAIRSVEGRAAMASLMRTIPHEQIGNIKATAKMADTYNKAMALMIADGTYSEDMLKMLGANLKDWDSASQGAFDKAAPYKLDSMLKLLSPTIESLRKAYRYDDKLTKEKNDGYMYKTVSDLQINDALNNSYMDLMNNPSMKYNMLKYMQENPGATEQDWKNKMFKQVQGQLGEEKEWDKLAEEKRNRAFEAGEKAKDRALSRELAEAKKKNDKTAQPIGWAMSTLDQSLEKLGAGIGDKNDPRAVLGHALLTQTAKGLGYTLRTEYSTWATYLRNNGAGNCFTHNFYFNPNKVSNKNAIHNLAAIHVDQRQLARSIGASGSVSQTQKDGDNSQSRTVQATSITIPYNQLYRIYSDTEMKHLHIYSSRGIKNQGAVVGRNGTFKDLNKSYAGTGETPKLTVTFTPSAVGKNYTHQIAHDGKIHIYIKGTVRVSGKDGGSIKTHGFFSRNLAPYQEERWYDAGEYTPAIGLDGSPNVNVQAIDSQIADDYNLGIKSVDGGYGIPVSQ